MLPPSHSLPFDIDIAISEPRWAESLSDIKALCDIALGAVWPLLNDGKAGELSVALVSDADIRELNHRYRHKDRATNVLSFPSIGLGTIEAGPSADMTPPTVLAPIPILGDIVLAFETISREAAGKSVSVQDHVSHLLIHGFLHLQGYSHETEDEAQIMEGLEIAALKRLSIDNPYEIQEPLGYA